MTLPNKLQSIFTSEQKYTVLQLIKALIDATKEGTIANIEVVRTDAAHIVLRFITNDGTYYDTTPIVIGAADLETVYAMLQASNNNITVTKDTSTNKVVIGLSNNINVTSVTAGSILSNGSIKAATLEQTQANYSSSFTWLPQYSSYIENVYSRVIVINGVLWLVSNIKVTAPEDNFEVRTLQSNIYLPAEVAAKIYDFKGHTAAEAVANNTIITIENAGVYGKYGIGGYPFHHRFDAYVENRTAQNMISFYFRTLEDSGFTLNAGEFVLLSARIPLTLL